MNSSEISSILSSDPIIQPIFAGYSFPDKHVNISSFPSLTIINTDKSTGPGEHWCVAYFDNNKHCDYFDPLGISPFDQVTLQSDVFPILNQFDSPISFSINPVQSMNAKTCGPHCIYFSFLRCRKFSFDTILRYFYFSDNTQANDSLVVQFMRKHGFPFNPSKY